MDTGKFLGKSDNVRANFTADFKSWGIIDPKTAQVNGLSLADLLADAGMDFNPLKVDLGYNDPISGKYQTAPDRFGIINPNTGAFLGAVGKEYTPVNYADIAGGVYGAMVEDGYIPARVLHFNGGARIFIAMIAPAEVKIGDRVHRTFTGISSGHDGGTVIQIGDTDFCPICTNTYRMALDEIKEGGRRAKHTKNVMGKLDEIRQQMFNVEASRKVYYDGLTAMMNRRVDSAEVNAFLTALVPDAAGAEKRASQAQANRRAEISRGIFLTTLEEGRKETRAYDLFAGVTRYVTGRTQNRNADEQFDYVMDGSGAKLSNAAYVLAQKLTA